MTALVEWILSAALTFAPIATRPQFKGYEETQEETLARYRSIAEDIAAAASEGDGKGRSSKERAALLLAVAIGESGLSADVDKSPCYREGGWKTRCDSGSSYTIWQLKHTLLDGKLVPGRDLQGHAKRRDAARGALRMIEGSLGMCSKLPVEDRLSMYGVGRCAAGVKSIRARHALYVKIASHSAPKEGK